MAHFSDLHRFVSFIDFISLECSSEFSFSGISPKMEYLKSISEFPCCNFETNYKTHEFRF